MIVKKSLFSVLCVFALTAVVEAGTDWASKTLGIKPKETKTETIGRRTVVWYSHESDPAWQAKRPYKDRFTVAKPVAGDKAGAPLMVQLHSRGGGKPSGGIEAQAKRADDKNSVYEPKDDFYVLALDSMRDFDVAKNKTHDEFWWGACGKFCGPKENDIARLRKGETSCEKRVLDTIEWVVRTYKIDRNRIYLCGNSMGGQGALAIGLPHGEIFAAIDANVPATIWFSAARMDFVDDKGTDNPAFDPEKFADPPFLVDWSGSDDVWSRNHDVLYRNMANHKFAILGLWGDFGHCGDVEKARTKNPMIERFDWTAIVKNAAYPVFTNASTDDVLPWPFSVWKPNVNTYGGWSGDIKGDSKKEIAAGAKPVGQVNGFFRWENVADAAKGLKMNLYLASSSDVGGVDVPASSTADVSIRRIQSVKLQPGQSVTWTFGTKKGTVKVDEHGLVTIPGLVINAKKQTLTIAYGQGQAAMKGGKKSAPATTRKPGSVKKAVR